MIPFLSNYEENILLHIKNETFESFKTKSINSVASRKRLSVAIEKLKRLNLVKYLNEKLIYSLESEIEKKKSTDNLIQHYSGEPFVYWNSKFSHSGITGYKVFEGYSRKMSKNSLRNLLNRKKELEEFNKEMQESGSRKEDYLSQKTKFRTISSQQSKKCRNYSQKLCYYSARREFTSKKTGKYHFKVAFLTLTTPSTCTPQQSLKAFEGFIDYLRRTANCTYIWKKELGELNEGLHYHILINNFIPYYIVAWKWKRLLINQGVIWPLNSEGKETSSHYRIELPRKLSKVNYYISKYIAKESKIPSEYGYIWGKSEVLDQCKEFQAMACDIPYEEVKLLKTQFKTVKTEYITHICVDLLKVKELTPELFAIFEDQYLEFQQKITLPQKFYYV
jgi:hypothetical protein